MYVLPENNYICSENNYICSQLVSAVQFMFNSAWLHRKTAMLRTTTNRKITVKSLPRSAFYLSLGQLRYNLFSDQQSDATCKLWSTILYQHTDLNPSRFTHVPQALAAFIINIFQHNNVILIRAAALYNLDKVKKAVSGKLSSEET